MLSDDLSEFIQLLDKIFFSYFSFIVECGYEK